MTIFANSTKVKNTRLSLVSKKSKFISILAKLARGHCMAIFLNQLKCIFLSVENCNQSKFNKVTRINQIHLKEITCFQHMLQTVQGTLTPWFRFISLEGIATLMACALETLTPRTPLGTLTLRAPLGTIIPIGFESGPYVSAEKNVYWVKYRYVISIEYSMHPHNPSSHTKNYACVS